MGTDVPRNSCREILSESIMVAPPPPDAAAAPAPEREGERMKEGEWWERVRGGGERGSVRRQIIITSYHQNKHSHIIQSHTTISYHIKSYHITTSHQPAPLPSVFSFLTWSRHFGPPLQGTVHLLHGFHQPLHLRGVIVLLCMPRVYSYVSEGVMVYG